MGIIVSPQSELIREPNLLVPHRVPVGQVCIDKKHPLARGLSFYVLSSQGGSNVVDLVSGKIGTVVGSTIKKAGSPRGQVIWNNGTDTDYYTFSSPPKVDCSKGYSIVLSMLSNVSGAAYDNGIFIVASSRKVALQNSGGNFIIALDEGWERYAATPVTDTGVWHTYALTQDSKLNTDSSGVVNAYRDAVLISTGGGRLYTTSSLTIGTYLKADYSLNGQVTYCGVWSRELRLDELQEITANPYQFLIPA